MSIHRTNDLRKVYKVTLKAGELLEYYAAATSAMEAIDIVADKIEDRDYTWCNEDYVSKNYAAKTMDVGAGAYRMTASPIELVNGI